MSDGKIVIETGLDTSGIEAGIGKMKVRLPLVRKWQRLGSLQ